MPWLKNLDRIEGDPKPWLYRVTVNICNDRYRRRAITAEPGCQALILVITAQVVQ